MPYPTEHAARLKDPDRFPKVRRENDKFGAGIHAVWGVLDDGTAELQAIRFDKDKFSEAEAKKWLEEHDHKPILFEPASEQKQEGLVIESFRLWESVDPSGSEWEVCLIQEGLSANNAYYSAPVLEKALPLFDKAKALAIRFAKNLFEHLPDQVAKFYPNSLIENTIVGWFTNPRLVALSEGGKGIVAHFHIAETANWLKGILKDAWENGNRQLLGFSIDAQAEVQPSVREGRTISEVLDIERVNSVDVVSHPAAGGQFLRLVASHVPKPHTGGNDMTKLTKLVLRLVEAIDKTAFKDVDMAKCSEADAKALLRKVTEAYEADGIAGKTFQETLKSLLEMVQAGNQDGACKLIEALIAGEPLSIPAEETKPTAAEAEEAAKKKAAEEAAAKEAAAIQEAEKKRLANMTESEKRMHEAEQRLAEALKKTEAAAQRMEEQNRIVESQTFLATRLAECRAKSLPAATVQKIESRFKGIAFKPADLDAVITEEEKYLATLRESEANLNFGSRIAVGESDLDSYAAAMDGLWARQNQKTAAGKVVPRFRSLKEAYRVVARCQGEPRLENILGAMNGYTPDFLKHENYWMPQEKSLLESRNMRLREAALLTTDWAQVFGDSVTRQVIKGYNLDDLMTYEKIVSQKNTGLDFRTQRRLRIGGFGTLSTVSQGGSYTELSVPTDEEATYSLSKHGNIFYITIEDIANDDMGMLQKLTSEMYGLGRAARLTLYRSIWDMFNNDAGSGLGYEQDGSTEIATSARGNYGTTALSSAALDAIKIAMMGQTAYGNTSEYFGTMNVPKLLVVPAALEPTAQMISKNDYVVQIDALYSTGTSTLKIPSGVINLHKGIEVVCCPYWDATDTNNYWVFADPTKIPIVELGFYGASDQPELFVADMPTSEHLFMADKIGWKIRFIYGYALLDYRGTYGSEVSGG